MPALLKVPLSTRIMLDLPTDEDPDQDTYVEVRQASQRDVEAINDLSAEVTRVFSGKNNESVSLKSKWSQAERERTQVFYTLADANIGSEEVDLKTKEARTVPLFRFQRIDGAMRICQTQDEFNKAWGKLPPHWARAIHNAVLALNPQWDPESAGE